MQFQCTNYRLSHLNCYARRQNAEFPFKIVAAILEDGASEDCFSKHIIQSKEEMFLNVGGTKFKIFKSNFYCLPGTRLAKLVRANNDKECLTYCDGIMISSKNKNREYFFNRSPQIFNYVLDIYREGTLHSPLEVCTTLLNQELKYWGIDDEMFEPCCALRYHQNLKDIKAQEKRFLNSKKNSMASNRHNQPYSSCLAKTYQLMTSMIRCIDDYYDNLATQIPCLYALVCTLREANKELLLVILLVLLLMLLSSILIYHVEFVEHEHMGKERGNKTFLDIIWWCLKVITTVGDNTYGPRTSFGQMIGGGCALIGVLIFSLPIPIVINSFSTYYDNVLWNNQIRARKNKLVKQEWI